MKKILTALFCALVLIGCEKGDAGAFPDVPTVTETPSGCRIEVPQILGSERAAVLEINGEIRELARTMEETYSEDEVMWCEMTAWPSETDRYISLVLHLQEFPAYGTCGQIQSWVYDRNTGERLTLDDALAMAETDPEAITADMAEWCGRNDYVMTADVPEFLCFRMTESGEPQFLTAFSVVQGGLVGETDPWSSFFTWTDGGIEWTYSVPFDPAEVNVSSSSPLYCQSLLNMGQDGDGAAIPSEEDAMRLFEEIYEINRYLEDGMTMVFDGSTVEIGGETCLCAVLGREENGEFTAEARYAAGWSSAYLLDPVTGEWSPVGFG